MMKKILMEMKKYFGPDKKRIKHAEKVLCYVKKILKEEQASYDVVMPAAILHDIGIKECERKYNSTDGQLQEKEGPPIAREILEKLKIKQEIIKEICEIISSHHSKGEINTLNFKVIWDADWLVNLKDEYELKDIQKIKNIISKVFLTQTGKKIAERVYLKNEKR